MSVYITSLAVFVAAVAGLLVVYSQKNLTLPGYKGKGSLGLPIVSAALGIGLLWGLGKLGGLSNVFTATGDSIGFSLAYDNALLTAGGVLALVGILALAAVATFNMVRYGRAVM